MTIILTFCLLLSLGLNVWLLYQLDTTLHNQDNSTWVTPEELNNIKKEIERLEKLNKGA